MTNLRPLVIAIVVSAAVNLAGSALFVWQSYEARQRNCENVTEAFDAYTQALADVTGAAESTVRDFRAAYEPHMKECH